MWCIYTVEYYSTTKKNEIMPCAEIWMDICRDMDGHGDCYTEVSQTENDKYHMVSLIRGI